MAADNERDGAPQEDSIRQKDSVQPGDNAQQGGGIQPGDNAQQGDGVQRTNELVARAYERKREQILERFAHKDVARDIVALGGMTEIYCADHHDDALRTPFTSEAVDAGVYPARKLPRLCPECAAHLRYGEVRRALCRRDPRPSCKTCSNHCYEPGEQAFQRKSMAYAGPRAMFRGYAIEAFRHLIQTRLS